MTNQDKTFDDGPSSDKPAGGKSDRTYDDLLADIIAHLTKTHEDGGEVTAHMCVIALDPAKDNRKMREFAMGVLKITKAEFKNALKYKRIKDTLGSNPETALEFVRLVMKRRHTALQYNGTVCEPDDPTVNYAHLMTLIRNEATELDLPFERAGLNDASAIWYEESKIARLPILCDLVAYDPACVDDGLDALLRLAKTCFDEDPALVVAAILKFFHQVKRKMLRLPVENHLMLVFLGETGAGKSTLAKRLFHLLLEASQNCSFTDMANDKIIEMWRNYIGFLDEMQGGNRAEIGIIKHVITADFIARRPMTTNLLVNIPQNLTFLGTSNATGFQEIVRDTTGTRRFLALTCKPLLDWEVVNTTDWLKAWKAVDETAADPMLAFSPVLKEKQETQRDKSNVELWLEQFKPLSMELERHGDRITGARIYADFRNYIERNFPGDKTDINWFGRRLAAVKNTPFKKAKSNGWWTWEPADGTYTDEPEPDEVQQRVVNLMARRNK